MPRRRDPSFLYMAALAGTGGAMGIVLSIGIPIWAWFHGQPYNPAFSLFAGWGVAALMGAYACVHTYLLTDSVPPPYPDGGQPVAELRRPAEAMLVPHIDASGERRAA